MNKKKLIFIIILLVLILSIGVLFTKMKKGDVNTGKNVDSSNVFKIWLFGDNKDAFSTLIDDFKSLNPDYEKMQFLVESFSDYDTYEKALSSSIIKGESPDIFVLNNNTSSFLEEQIVGISQDIISPSDFRKRYNGVFGDDLILSYSENENSVEFIKGIPVGYERLGIFYNRTLVKSSDIENFSGLNSTIADIRDKRDMTAIGIGNGRTVYNSSDIISQFLLLEGVDSYDLVEGNSLKQAFSNYFIYGDENSDNSYDSSYISLRETGENNLDMFSKGTLAMVIGYPRMLFDIDEKGFSKIRLLASYFPSYVGTNSKSLINYNYFVANKDSKNLALAYDFLKYLSSDNGSSNYLTEYSYYLPALLSLESDFFKNKISEDYNLYLGDFVNTNIELSSFNKGMKSVFDREIVPILDDPNRYEQEYDKLKSSIDCYSKKLVNLEGLSDICVN